MCNAGRLLKTQNVFFCILCLVICHDFVRLSRYTTAQIEITSIGSTRSKLIVHMHKYLFSQHCLVRYKSYRLSSLTETRNLSSAAQARFVAHQESHCRMDSAPPTVVPSTERPRAPRSRISPFLHRQLSRRRPGRLLNLLRHPASALCNLSPQPLAKRRKTRRRTPAMGPVSPRAS